MPVPGDLLPGRALAGHRRHQRARADCHQNDEGRRGHGALHAPPPDGAVLVIHDIALCVDGPHDLGGAGGVGVAQLEVVLLVDVAGGAFDLEVIKRSQQELALGVELCHPPLAFSTSARSAAVGRACSFDSHV